MPRPTVVIVGNHISDAEFADCEIRGLIDELADLPINLTICESSNLRMVRQNPNLNPTLNSRSSIPSRPLLAVFVMMPKLAGFEAFPDGLAKCAVLVRLKISRRSWSVLAPPSANCRNTLMSKLTKPGPRIVLYPLLPKRASVTGRNADVSNHGLPVPMPPRISTSSLIWSTVCVLPGMFNDVPADVIENGEPE